ncbi:unnamed protein product [Didymodactylos carnosus]|uniref:Uncharacterized protein n=1 Tax=Didymodactylos carnosus TaxID=1234261 RepID=A0A814RA34_9BILA|nr:unnamed protein product [Didymodactylos carnosus]CAF1130390.1 unnamed protein product [Didymodactylos carnosus]CAF3631316.1 unnamed protein product [Didymodactylos carnosus]CAF3894080.1 unnamed protein product [Didymodactylos carnosus]
MPVVATSTSDSQSLVVQSTFGDDTSRVARDSTAKMSHLMSRLSSIHVDCFLREKNEEINERTRLAVQKIIDDTHLEHERLLQKFLEHQIHTEINHKTKLILEKYLGEIEKTTKIQTLSPIENIHQQDNIENGYKLKIGNSSTMKSESLLDLEKYLNDCQDTLLISAGKRIVRINEEEMELKILALKQAQLAANAEIKKIIAQVGHDVQDAHDALTRHL